VTVWQGGPAGLTDREVAVLRLLAQGRTNREIADALVITEKTAGHHVEHIYAKAGVSTRVGAAIFAMRHDLLQ
jgi:DNA-binding NarL/FixJ family response regulator